MECPDCQTQNPKGNKFCRECGAKLSQSCPECGAQGLPGDKFCGECGQKLGGKEAAERIGTRGQGASDEEATDEAPPSQS